jgi:hypothetical protein
LDAVILDASGFARKHLLEHSSNFISSNIFGKLGPRHVVTSLPLTRAKVCVDWMIEIELWLQELLHSCNWSAITFFSILVSYHWAICTA